MAVHVWLALDSNRPGVRCANCFTVASKCHQDWECPGSPEDTQIPEGFQEWLAKHVYEAVTEKMTAQIWDGLPVWAMRAILLKVEQAEKGAQS